MHKRERNVYLGADSEDENDTSATLGGYDSEEAELGLSKTRGRRTTDVKGRKRQRISSEEERSDAAELTDDNEEDVTVIKAADLTPESNFPEDASEQEDEEDGDNLTQIGSPTISPQHTKSTSRRSSSHSSAKASGKSKRPGIIYLPSLPPHLKPSALKDLLQQRGFSPVTRLFLTPTTLPSTTSGTSKSRARKTYTEGWLEFSSHKTAKRCVEALNATTIGGPKRGYYHDDLWNMRYLHGMSWADLMGQIREERREEEVRKGEDRRTVKREVEQFLRGVERSKRDKTQAEKEKRKKTQGNEADEDAEPEGHRGKEFRWEQFRVKGRDPINAIAVDNDQQRPAGIDETTRRVLGSIF